MSEKPQVKRERGSGVDGLAIIAEVHTVRLSEKISKVVEVHRVLANVEHTMSQGTQGADGVEGAICVFVSRRKQEQAQALAASKRNQIASLRLLGGWKKASHFDRNK